VNTSFLLASQATSALSALTCLPVTWLGISQLRIDSRTFFISEHFAASPDTILLASYFPPAQALTLRQQGRNYLDTAGNAFVQAPGICLIIEGQPPITVSPTTPPPVGLRLLYYLLSEPELLQAPYRTLSQRADVALGSVNAFFAELREQGLARQQVTGRVLKADALLTRWVQQYAEVLRPQRYRWATAPRIRWTQLPMVTGAYWGGEPAARLLLGEKRFSPTSFTLYSPSLPTWGLVPDPVNGVVDILTPPFPPPTVAGRSGIAAPLIIYTDLLLSGKALDQELAQQVRSRYLAYLA
jgi:hypothetical protein